MPVALEIDVRRNFADILKSFKVEPRLLYSNLATLFFNERTEVNRERLSSEYCSLFDWCEKNFRKYPYKRCCISLCEFNDSRVEFRNIKSMPYGDYESQVDSLILLCEYILNFLMYIPFPYELNEQRENTLHCIDEILNELHLVKTKKQDGMYIITHADPVIEAVSAVVDDDIAIALVKYTHHSMEGNIGEKRKILCSLSQCLESKRTDLKIISKDITDSFFCGVNNLNIRHDNVTENTANYNPGIALLSDVELEAAYDSIFRIGVALFSIIGAKEDMSAVRKLSKRQGK